MEMSVTAWLWTAGLGGAGGAVSAWLAHQRAGRVSMTAGVAAATAAATAWMIGHATPLHLGTTDVPGALAVFWIGFVTAGWIAAEHDKLLLRQAVCRAVTAPAAHPDTVQALAHASPDDVYEAVQALVPRRVVH